MIRLDTVARVKASLQANGVRIPPELVSDMENRYNAPAVRTGRLVVCLELPEGNGELVPAFIINGKRVADSPFHMVRNGQGKYEVRTGDEKYTDITLLPRPKFYDNLTSGGLPMHKVAVIVGPGHMRSVVNQRCTYHETGKPCKFCAVQYWWNSAPEKSTLQIAETVEAGVKEGLVEHLSLTTATLNTMDKGLRNLVRTAVHIQSRVEIPVMLEFEPINDFDLLESLLQVAKQAGVTTISCNIECFDSGIRRELMPAKGNIPVDTYVRTWQKCLEIFGENEVFTVAVAGIGEDDESILMGVEMAASHGVMTFLVPHSPAIGAVFEDMEPPSPERMLSLYRHAAEIYDKHGLDLCASRAGCVRGGGFSAIKDVAKFGV